MKKNKNILITGSSQGIGKNIADLLCKSGHNIFITGRDPLKLKKVASQINAKDFLAIDLCEKNASSSLYEKTLKTLGPIDVLINNAGEYIYSPIEKTTKKEIEALFKLNIETPYLLSQLVIPQMKTNKWGRIINIGSISGSTGEANASLYSTTKAALIGLSKSLALELAAFNITVNTINPGWVDTELIKNESLEEDFSKDEIIEMVPQRRFIHPKEVAHLCQYLVSEEAKGITGQSINLCAGLSLG